MGFIEPVPGEFFHQVEDIGRGRFSDAARQCPLDKYRPLLRHLLGLFLAHRPTQQVGTAQGITRQDLGNLHHLLLIQDDAVGRLEDWFKIRVRILDLGATMLAIDKVIDHARLQGPGSIQGHQGDNIFKGIRLQTPNQIFHAARFKLEHRRGLKHLQQFESLAVIERYRVEFDRLLGVQLAHRLQSPIDDRQGAQAQEIKFHQTNRFNIILVKMGDQTAAVGLTIKCGKISQGRGRDDHAPGMFARIARKSLELQGQIENTAHFLVTLVQRLQVFAFVQGAGQGHAQFKWNQFSDFVNKTIAMP